MKKQVLLVIGLLFLLGAGCNQQSPAARVEQNKPAIRIGLAIPMTGDAANYGEQAQLASQLAADEVNAAGGINGRKLELITEDAQCDAKTATNAANKLININKVPVVLPLCSSETLAVAPIAEQAKVVVLAPASTNPEITESGDYIFRLSPSDSFQGRYVAEHVYNTLNKRKIAILFNSDSEWSVGVKNVFRERFQELGGEIVAGEGALSDARDYRSNLLKIKESNPELVYFPSMVNSALIGLKQMKEIGITVPVLGGDVWDDVKIPQSLGAAVNGVQFTVMANKKLPENFVTNMGKDPRGKDINAYSPRFYDAIHMLAQVMRTAGDNPEKIKNELYKINNYQGIAETYTIDRNGDIANATYTLKEFKDGKIVEAGR